MQSIYTIGGYAFVALDSMDATFSAIAKARQLMREGQAVEANRLFEEAVRVRQEIRRMKAGGPKPRSISRDHAGRMICQYAL